MVASVRECYAAATKSPLSPWDPQKDSDFMDWCEEMISEWNEGVLALGYSLPCWCVGNASGDLTYHEWLTKKVGL